jgi:hypothetical protein
MFIIPPGLDMDSVMMVTTTQRSAVMMEGTAWISMPKTLIVMLIFLPGLEMDSVMDHAIQWSVIMMEETAWILMPSIQIVMLLFLPGLEMEFVMMVNTTQLHVDGIVVTVLLVQTELLDAIVNGKKHSCQWFDRNEESRPFHCSKPSLALHCFVTCTSCASNQCKDIPRKQEH